MVDSVGTFVGEGVVGDGVGDGGRRRWSVMPATVRSGTAVGLGDAFVSFRGYVGVVVDGNGEVGTGVACVACDGYYNIS